MTRKNRANERRPEKTQLAQTKAAPEQRQPPAESRKREQPREDAPELRLAAETLPAPAGPVVVREAWAEDLPRLVAFEIEIARISFPREPVDDPAVHEKKLRKALDLNEPGMFVLDRGGAVVGWLWITLNTNFLTAERYATFRSMAADESQPDGPALAELLFNFGIAYARRLGLKEITGKVHVNNVRMRLLYRQSGFESEHLTMKLYLDA